MATLIRSPVGGGSGVVGLKRTFIIGAIKF